MLVETRLAVAVGRVVGGAVGVAVVGGAVATRGAVGEDVSTALVLFPVVAARSLEYLDDSEVPFDDFAACLVTAAEDDETLPDATVEGDCMLLTTTGGADVLDTAVTAESKEEVEVVEVVGIGCDIALIGVISGVLVSTVAELGLDCGKD